MGSKQVDMSDGQTDRNGAPLRPAQLPTVLPSVAHFRDDNDKY